MMERVSMPAGTGFPYIDNVFSSLKITAERIFF